MPIKAIAFDAYGTLFDVYSIAKLAETIFPTKGAQLASLWRDKQVDYTRLRDASGQYADFWQITGDALDYTAAALGLTLTADARDQLMGQYARLDAFAENAAQLQRLTDAGLPLAILSNGTPWMLDQALQAAGLTGYFTHVLSVDSVKRFKTAPQAYQIGPDAFGVAAQDILFVSSNGWDICGASWFGYRTIWLNRAGAVLERLGVTPDRIGTSLCDVADYALDLQSTQSLA
jgi:2-haloacid dehalogenase